MKAGRLWLVGGGLPFPLTYARLAGVLRNPVSFSESPCSVAEILLLITQTLIAGRRLDVPEVTGAGENYEGCTGKLPTVAIERGDADWDAMADTVVSSPSQVVLRTSGSTGLPTEVIHPVSTLFRGVVRAKHHRDDVWGLAFNPSHFAGLQVYLQAVANTNTVVNLWGLAPRAAIERCLEWQVSHVSATPTYYRLLLAEGAMFPAVRSASLGGEPADGDLLERLHGMFPNARLRNIYASTEAGTLLSSSGAEFSIPPERAADLAIWEGRIWVRRPLLGDFAGATEWYDTGDRVELTPGDAQRFRILGRERRGVNVGGEKVDPMEVEQALTSHPQVVLARVTGRKNSVTGEILTAEVVARSVDLTEQTLRHYLSSRLPPYKVPRLIRFVAKLDLTRTCKVRP